MHQARRKKIITLILCVWALGMLGFSFLMVPLYRMFCSALKIPVPTILSGPTARAMAVKAAMPGVSNRTVAIHFIANVGAGVPVQFAPMSYTVQAHLGRPVLTAYRAFNTSPAPMDGVAVHMLYGFGDQWNEDVGNFVDLQQCFCFELQRYPGQQEITLPLSFTIRPDLPTSISSITFSYTLFQALPDDPRIRPTARQAQRGAGSGSALALPASNSPR